MLWGKLASTPPSIVTGGYAVSAFVFHLLTRDEHTAHANAPILSAIWIVVAVLTVGWILDLYLTCSVVRGRQPNKGVLLAFLLSAGAFVLGYPLSLSRPTDPIVPAVFFCAILLFFFVAWQAATALVTSEEKLGERAKHTTFITFVQIVYLAIGVWYLCPRVETLLTHHGTNTKA